MERRRSAPGSGVQAMTVIDALALSQPSLRVRRIRLHTQHQPVAVMRTDCHVCRSEGLSARSQVLVSNGARQVQAVLFQIDGGSLLALDEVGLSEAAWPAWNSVVSGKSVSVRGNQGGRRTI